MDTINQELLELVTYSVTDAALAKLANDCMGLRVNSPDDEYGYAICKEWRGEVRRKRIEVEDRRKELKKDSLEFGRVVDAEARRITAKIKEVEDHLVKQLDVVDELKRKEKEEFDRQLKERTQIRVATAQELRAVYDLQWLTTCTDDDFLVWYRVAKERFDRGEAERIAQAKRMAELEAECARLREAEQAKINKVVNELIDIDKDLSARRQAVEEWIAAKEEMDLDYATQMFAEIREQFPTLELAWAEIARLEDLLSSTNSDD